MDCDLESPPIPGPTPSIPSHIQERNRRIEQELNLERQSAVAARARSLHEGRLISTAPIEAKAVAIATAAAYALTKTTSTKPKSYHTLGVSTPILHGAIVGATSALAACIVATSNAQPSEKAKVWQESVKTITASLVLGGLAGYLVQAIERGLLVLGQKLSDRKALGVIANRVLTLEGPIIMGAVETGYNLGKALWHSVRKLMAELRGDEDTAREEEAQRDKILSFDTACRIFAHFLSQTISTAALVSLGPVGGLVAMSVKLLAPVIAVTIADAMVDAMIAKKNAHGSGWGDWLLSFVLPDRRHLSWVGDDFEIHVLEHPILRELECGITHCIVVDPVRSTLTGTLYERHALNRWLKERGTDPVLIGERVTAMDYIPAPIAKKWAHNLARELGAQLAPFGS